MNCMCAQTRPRFILSSERVLGGMEFEPMLTPREKSPLPENFPRGGSNPRRCGQLPTSYSGQASSESSPLLCGETGSDNEPSRGGREAASVCICLQKSVVWALRSMPLFMTGR